MKNKKTKWFAYTVLVGMIPFLSRFVVWLIATSESMQVVAASDFVAFGLVLHISNINELEHVSSAKSNEWKTIQNGVSLIFIAVYSVLYASLLIGEKNPTIINSNSMLVCTIFLSLASLALSFSIFHRLSKITP